MKAPELVKTKKKPTQGPSHNRRLENAIFQKFQQACVECLKISVSHYETSKFKFIQLLGICFPKNKFSDALKKSTLG